MTNTELYNDLNNKITKFNYKYALIQNNKPFLFYKKSIRPVIYLETIQKSRYGGYEYITYKLTQNGSEIIGSSTIWSTDSMNEWIEYHKKQLSEQKGLTECDQ